MRTTINKVNERINQHGFELVRGKGYYYFAALSNDSAPITETGIYGTPYLGAWTVDQLESMLLERIEEANDFKYDPTNSRIINVKNNLDKS